MSDMTDVSTTIENLSPPAVPLLACFMPGADALTKADGTVVRVERAYALALVLEEYSYANSNEDREARFVVPVVDADDGTMILATEMDGYIGFIEAPSRFDGDLPIVMDLREEANDPALLRRVRNLVVRHNTRKQVREAPEAPVVTLASKRAGTTEPAPPPREE
jgi:hypothetical protein